MEININKDIREYTEGVFFGLNLRPPLTSAGPITMRRPGTMMPRMCLIFLLHPLRTTVISTGDWQHTLIPSPTVIRHSGMLPSMSTTPIQHRSSPWTIQRFLQTICMNLPCLLQKEAADPSSSAKSDIPPPREKPFRLRRQLMPMSRWKW